MDSEGDWAPKLKCNLAAPFSVKRDKTTAFAFSKKNLILFIWKNKKFLILAVSLQQREKQSSVL